MQTIWYYAVNNKRILVMTQKGGINADKNKEMEIGREERLVREGGINGKQLENVFMKGYL